MLKMFGRRGLSQTASSAKAGDMPVTEKPRITRDVALARIHRLVDGTVWDADTIMQVAIVLEDAGYHVRGLDDLEPI